MRALWLTLILAIGSGGCASFPDDVRRIGADASIELVDTPFFPQDQYQCGPAALATVLRASGADVTVAGLVDKVYLPGRRGSLRTEMIAATRTSGRIPYRIDGSMMSLLDELERGRTVVVLQNLGIAAIPRWHYAVVVGINAGDKSVILRSGIDKRRLTPITTFLHTWRRSDYWGLVALRPGELPANVSRARYLASVVAFESAAGAAAALAAWDVAVGQWPEDPLALFGLANAHYALDDFVHAENLYVRLLRIDESQAVARNNLAIALAKQNRFAEAMRQIEQALAANSDPRVAAEFEDTRQTIINLRAE